MPDSRAAIDRTVEQVARQSYGKLLAFVVSRTRDLAGAEDALSDAFASALAVWPLRGMPHNPEGWLLAVARRKSIDAARRRRTRDEAANILALLASEAADDEHNADIPDDRLRLMFACAHPAIDLSVRAPLILQTVLGFEAGRIAAAFLIAPATMGQRLVRAKRKILEAGVPFRVPDAEEWGERLPCVLDAIYACFSVGWADLADALAHDGTLTEEAIWLARLVVALLPDEPEALGLLALMLHAQARQPARRDAVGEYMPLDAQDPAAWTAVLIDEAEDVLRRASRHRRIGRYQLEAAIQSAHAARRYGGPTDWTAIAGLYDALLDLTGSPVAALNRAVAVGRAVGADVGLAAVEALEADRRLHDYQPYWAARADLLAANGNAAAAANAMERAIGLEADPAVRRFLLGRLGQLRSIASPNVVIGG
jgi:RNA polymerase sigma-70 factor, ECF subfamily